MKALAALALVATLSSLGCSDAGPGPAPPVEIVTLVRGFTMPAGLDAGASDDAFLVAYGGSARCPVRAGPTLRSPSTARPSRAPSPVRERSTAARSAT